LTIGYHNFLNRLVFADMLEISGHSTPRITNLKWNILLKSTLFQLAAKFLKKAHHFKPGSSFCYAKFN